MVDTADAEIRNLQKAVEKERLESELLHLRAENARLSARLMSLKASSPQDSTDYLSLLSGVTGVAATITIVALFSDTFPEIADALVGWLKK